jgi:protein-S-isoprenylcysteine O-methyltransferase Ste14
LGTSMHAVFPVYLFNERPLWSIVFWVSYVTIFVVSSWVNSRERSAARCDNRDRGSRPLIYVASVIGNTCAFAAPSLLPSARIGLPPEPVFTTAITLMWAGVILYHWAVLTLGAYFRTSVQLLDGQRLVTRGPYHLLRHPAYTGGILLYSGIGLATGNWISAVAAPLSVAIAYAWRIHVEEIVLRERFGAEFETHRRRTWAVIPLVW